MTRSSVAAAAASLADVAAARTSVPARRPTCYELKTTMMAVDGFRLVAALVVLLRFLKLTHRVSRAAAVAQMLARVQWWDLVGLEAPRVLALRCLPHLWPALGSKRVYSYFQPLWPGAALGLSLKLRVRVFLMHDTQTILPPGAALFAGSLTRLLWYSQTLG